MAAVLRKAVEEKYPELENVHQRRNHKMDRITVHVGQLPLSTMVPTSEEVQASFFEWNYEALEELKVEKEAVLEKALHLLENPDNDVQWRV